MNSSDLSAYGFGVWHAFNPSAKKSLLAVLPERPGAYVVRCCRDYQRRVGRSDILYVGSGTNSKGLRHRVRQYFHPGWDNSTSKRILALISASPDFEISAVETNSIPEAKMLEATLLEKYEIEHGELPPENKRH